MLPCITPIPSYPNNPNSLRTRAHQSLRVMYSAYHTHDILVPLSQLTVGVTLSLSLYIYTYMIYDYL